MKNIKFSTVSTVEATEVTPKTLSWSALTKLLIQSKFQESGRDGSGLVPSKIEKGEGQTEATKGRIGRFRQSHLVEHISLLVLDIEETEISDDPEKIMKWIEKRLPDDTLHAVYTTYHHGVAECDRCCDQAEKWEPDYPRLRLVVPLVEPVEPENYELLFRWAEDTFDGVDTQTKDPTRISYLPRMPHPDAELDGFVLQPLLRSGEVSARSFLRRCSTDRENEGLPDRVARRQRGDGQDRWQAIAHRVEMQP